jgi:hypothetical protein
MRTLLRTLLAAALTVAVLGVLADPVLARGGGGGGKGGGGKRGGGRGKDALGGRSPTDYLDQSQREGADAARADLLFATRYGSLVRAASDDRAAALRAARDRASAQRRDAAESGAHPL